MNIERASFEEVFNGEVNFVTEAIVSGGFEDLARRFGRVPEGVDNLDTFRAMPFMLYDDNIIVLKFAFWQYNNDENDEFEIRMPISSINRHDYLPVILRAFRIPSESVYWKAESPNPEDYIEAENEIMQRARGSEPSPMLG